MIRQKSPTISPPARLPNAPDIERNRILDEHSFVNFSPAPLQSAG
jgi:hypothetical protein